MQRVTAACSFGSEVQRPSRSRQLRDKPLLARKLPESSYALKRKQTNVAEHRALQTQLRNLRHVTRQAKAGREKSSLSTIHNMSVSMIEAIKGARMRRSSLSQQEPTDVLLDFLPRQMSLPLPGKSRSLSSSQQIKTLTLQMETVLESNAVKLAQPSSRPVKARPSVPQSRRLCLERMFPAPKAETVLTQLKRDIRRLDTKIRLLMSSLMLVEEDISTCSLSLKEKRKKLMRRANSLRSLLAFIKEVKEKAESYVSLISSVLSGTIPSECRDSLAFLFSDIKAMASSTRAIEFVAAKVKVQGNLDLTKRELLKHGQVSFANFVPRLMGHRDSCLSNNGEGVG